MGSIFSLIGFLLVLGIGGLLLELLLWAVYRRDGGKLSFRGWRDAMGM